jgi:hypothetical protein
MFAQFEDVQKFSKDAVENASKSFGVWTKGSQAVAAEVADYSKKSLENVSSAAEKLVGVKSIEKAFEIQAEFAKSAYEGFVSHATKVGELYQNLARDAFKPLEPAFAAPTKASK